MLSSNLNSLLEHFHRYAVTGMELDPEAVFTIIAILEAAAEDAGELEAHRIRVAVVPNDLPANVISMAIVRASSADSTESTDGPEGAA